MPSKGRWALNPRKWFGTVVNAAHKRDKKTQANNSVAPLPTTTVRAIPSIVIGPHILTSKNSTKVEPSASINEKNYINSTNTSAAFTQFRLPPFRVHREKTSTLVSTSTLLSRAKTSHPASIEPSIRKNSQFKDELSIGTTRWKTEVTAYNTSKSLVSTQHGNSVEKRSDINTIDQCLIDCPPNLSNHIIEKSPSPIRSNLSSSIDDNDERDESSSSGIFTDERADSNDHHRAASKDTLATLDALSIESIADSQTSLNPCPPSPLVQRYRLPLSTFETIHHQSSQLQRQTLTVRSARAQSAENILKDNSTTIPIPPKHRLSSAAIVKKIEKRNRANRSPSDTLEKAGLVRVTNATYRLTSGKDDHLYRRQRKNSLIQYSNCEDSLPLADDEESYANLPRTSSTDQLTNNLQDDLRAMIDDYLRPVITSMNKPTSRTPKTPHRSKRYHNNDEYPRINIDDITEKLLSSIDCSTYAQYQRCY